MVGEYTETAKDAIGVHSGITKEKYNDRHRALCAKMEKSLME